MAQKRSVNPSRKANQVTSSSSGPQTAANEETARLKKRTREGPSLEVVPNPQGEASKSAETATPPALLDLNSKEAASGFALESPETLSFLNEVPGQDNVEMEDALDLERAFGSPVEVAKQGGSMAAMLPHGDLEESPRGLGADWWSERLSAPAEPAEGSSGKKGRADGSTLAEEQPLVDIMVPSLANSLELPVPDPKQPAGDLEDLTTLLFQDDDNNDDPPYWDSRTDQSNSASAFEWANVVATPESSTLHHQPQAPFADLEKQVSAVQALLPLFGPSSTFPQEQQAAAFDGVASIVARLASSIAMKSLEQPQASAPAAREFATLRAENEELRLQLQNRESQLEALQEGLGVMMHGLCRLHDVSHVDDSTQNVDDSTQK